MGKLILIGGSLATGKTTLAGFLEEQVGIKRISMDELKEAFFDLAGYKNRDWSKCIGSLAWPVFKEFIEMYVQRGEDVIAEATFLWPDDSEWIESLVDRHGVDVRQLWMTTDPLVARKRFIERSQSQERHPGHCDELEHVLGEFDERFFKQTFEPLAISGKTKIVDTTDFNSVDHDSILAFIS